MSATTDNRGSSYEQQLSDLESRLKSHDNDEAMLAEVGSAMRALLSGDGQNERHIRQILERQFDQGNLRQESYELVEKLLGKIATEETAARTPATIADQQYTETTVLDQPGQQAPNADSNRLQIGSVLRDRFLLKKQIAEGSMGVVYKALDRRLAETGDENAYVAIKVLSPKLSRNGAALRALQQEAAKGRCLAHPNIVRFIDLDRDDDLYFIVMEWLEGRSLSSILDDKGGNGLDLPTALDIVRQTALALDYAHQRGVVHADVKPGNIIITPDGDVKLIDFGVARVRQKELEGKARLDPAVVRGGSPAYSSMQVLTGEDPVPADDVFSLACLMYRLVAGYRVFGPRNAADAAEAGMEPQRPQNLSTTQWQALKKALSYSRVTRFATPGAFLEALGGAAPERETRSTPAAAKPSARAVAAEKGSAIAIDEPMRAEREPIMYEPEDEPRRSPWRLALVGLVVIGAVAAAIQTGVLEGIAGVDLSSLAGRSNQAAVQPRATAEADDLQDLEPAAESIGAGPPIAAAAGEVVEEIMVGAEDGTQNVAPATDVAPAIDAETETLPALETEPDPAPLLDPPIDFSQLPPPTVLLTLAATEDAARPEASITLREDGSNAIIDLVRGGDLSLPAAVQFVESAFSGNQSSWESGQYELENEGLLTFDAGQPRARIVLSMRSDPIREPDRQVTLSIRDVANPATVMGTIKLTLEDDDQRAFEEGLPNDTVGFAVNQVSVRESDPAVQIDVVRYKPSNTALEVSYTLRDVTATEGQDYFSPSLTLIYFAPGQRTARILIPLGHDTRPEQDEAFMLQLDNGSVPAGSNIFSQIAVMIRDDDS